MLKNRATKDIVGQAESAYQARLAKKQAALAEKNRQKATTTQPPSSVLLWAAQLEKTLTDTLATCMSEPEKFEIREALASALPKAIHQLESVILSRESTVADRTRASNTIAWLFSVCTRTQVRLSRSDALKEIAMSKRKRNEALKAQTVLKQTEADLAARTEKQRIARVLREAAQEQQESTGEKYGIA